jgi:hypothetical protein
LWPDLPLFRSNLQQKSVIRGAETKNGNWALRQCCHWPFFSLAVGPLLLLPAPHAAPRPFPPIASRPHELPASLFGIGPTVPARICCGDLVPSPHFAAVCDCSCFHCALLTAPADLHPSDPKTCPITRSCGHPDGLPALGIHTHTNKKHGRTSNMWGRMHTAAGRWEKASSW